MNILKLIFLLLVLSLSFGLKVDLNYNPQNVTIDTTDKCISNLEIDSPVPYKITYQINKIIISFDPGEGTAKVNYDIRDCPDIEKVKKLKCYFDPKEGVFCFAFVNKKKFSTPYSFDSFYIEETGKKFNYHLVNILTDDVAGKKTLIKFLIEIPSSSFTELKLNGETIGYIYENDVINSIKKAYPILKDYFNYTLEIQDKVLLIKKEYYLDSVKDLENKKVNKSILLKSVLFLSIIFVLLFFIVYFIFK